MFIAVRSNVRTAAAAQKSLKDAVTVSLRGGAVSGFLVVALSLLGVSGIFLVYSRILGNPTEIAPFLIVGFGFGASFVALFAQLGGGIYTKAADVGADLVGKVEAGIPEDDPRNAAVVADLVGDNVGDCAGRGADLFESMSAENIGAMILGVAIFSVTGKIEWIMFPLVLRSFGIIATIVGLTSVPFFTDGEPQEQAGPDDAAELRLLRRLGALRRRPVHRHQGDAGRRLVLVLLLRPRRHRDGHRLRLHHAVLHGGLVAPGAGDRARHRARARRRTSSSARRSASRRRRSRPSPSAWRWSISFALGSQADINTAIPAFTTGIFGTAVATMGMLMSAAYILSMDTFGPITDNAGGITEMSGAPESAREITDKLDAVGNTTKALTKGYAVASAGLAAFLLFSAYLDKVKERLEIPLTAELPIDLSNVDVFVGGLLGVMLVFLFSSLAIRAVGNAAGAIIEEVRRQFRADPGILAGTSRPDYAAAVDITAKAALRADDPAGHPGGRPAGRRRPDLPIPARRECSRHYRRGSGHRRRTHRAGSPSPACSSSARSAAS